MNNIPFHPSNESTTDGGRDFQFIPFQSGADFANTVIFTPPSDRSVVILEGWVWPDASATSIKFDTPTFPGITFPLILEPLVLPYALFSNRWNGDFGNRDSVGGDPLRMTTTGVSTGIVAAFKICTILNRG